MPDVISIDGPDPSRHPSLDCPHGHILTFSYGLRKCLDCGSIEGSDKVWRHPEVLRPAP
jgi:hypothetical protein